MDDLDECPDTSEVPSPCNRILQLLEELADLQVLSFRICVTSRPEFDPRRHNHGYGSYCIPHDYSRPYSHQGGQDLEDMCMTHAHDFTSKLESNDDSDQRGNCCPGMVIDFQLITTFFLTRITSLVGLWRMWHSTDLTASNPSHMPFVMCMLVAPVLSHSQLPYPIQTTCTPVQTTPTTRNRSIKGGPNVMGTEDTPDRAMARRGLGNRNTACDRGNEFQSSFQ